MNQRKRQIIELYRNHVPIKDIAKHFGVTSSYISRVANPYVRRYRCRNQNAKNQQLELPFTFLPKTSRTSKRPRTSIKLRLETLFGPIVG